MKIGDRVSVIGTNITGKIVEDYDYCIVILDDDTDEYYNRLEFRKSEVEKIMNSFDTVEGQEWLKSLLHERVVKVTFTKKDGSDRVLSCTLNDAMIPKKVTESQVIEGKPDRVKSTESLAVYDVENQDWRSFRWDSIKSVDFILHDKFELI